MPDAKYLDIEGDILQTINAEIAHLREKNALSYEDARARVLDMKKTKKLSYNKMIDGNVNWTSPNARKHWSRVVKSAKKITAEKRGVWNAKSLNAWWVSRIVTALPEKTIDYSGGGGREVGEVTVRGTTRKAGSALETEMNQGGLYTAFEDKTQPLLRAMDAIDRGDSNFTNECTTFAADKKREIALSKLRERNKRVVELREDGVKDELDLTCGMKMDAFIGKFGSVEGMKQLEAMSRKRAAEEAGKAGVTDQNTIHAAGTLIWLVSAKSLSEYFFIILALDHQHCCAQIDKEGVWRIFLKGEEVMSFQKCVGLTIKSGASYDDCERTLTGYQHTFFEMWATSDEPFVIDLDPKSDPRCNEPLHKKIRITSTSTSESIGLARAVKLSIVEGSGGELTRYVVSHVKTINHHRLVAIVKSHYRFDPLRNCPIMTAYLGLKEGQTFEDLDGYKYHQNLSERSIRMMIRKENYLKKRMWDGRLLGKWTDVDHLIGRSQKWMNSDFFCMHVSHSWNQAMSYVRIMYGDWLYGFASIEYGSGND
jgi:hypothetical protein